MTLRRGGSSTPLRGADAAAFGAGLIERSKGGRPSIDPDAKPGQHSRAVQVRVDDNLDRALEDLARAQHRSKSAVVRDALAAYVARH
ncbi:ribbon-helix-helix domain-containing protein [Pengzhenrongella sp.]|jgi:hypothetical protein|uniref:ribbon-helix-helix domain-containing protein n=1 Tax=Pengzhenrongella sp. TaxID=2888820 RepID=UPI002F93FAE3